MASAQANAGMNPINFIIAAADLNNSGQSPWEPGTKESDSAFMKNINPKSYDSLHPSPSVEDRRDQPYKTPSPEETSRNAKYALQDQEQREAGIYSPDQDSSLAKQLGAAQLDKALAKKKR
jgi:hypothetical protein